MTGTLYNIVGGKIDVHGTTAGSFLIENGQEGYQLVLVVTEILICGWARTIY